MILFCDEDIGTGVPTALHLVGYETFSMVKRGWMSKPDEDWLEVVGNKGWLVFSKNKKMLMVPKERQAIIDNKVGIVFLTKGEENLPRVLWLLLVKWSWLERIHQEVERPFAFFVSPTGRSTQTYTYRGMRLSL